MIMSFNRGVRLAALLCAFAVASCTALYDNHGYMPPAGDLQQLRVGVDTRAKVNEVIGPPSTASLVDEGNYYYVRSRVRTYGMFRPKVMKRQILAISFNPNDTIRNIERFGLERGRIVPLSRRVTDNSVVSSGFLRQMLRNIGNFNPASFLN